MTANSRRKLATCLLLAAAVLATTAAGAAEPRETPASFTLLSYNVGGLPKGQWPRHRFPAIGQRERNYDVVLNQEVFVSASRLVEQMNGKQSVAGVGIWPDPEKVLLKGLVTLFVFPVFVHELWPPYGSGLYTFVDPRLIPGGDALPAAEIERAPYRECHGYFSSKTDCFSRKGYVRVGITAPGGVAVDVYNTHLDAGNDAGSRRARKAQFLQLACAIEARDSGRPVIVAGDLNTAYSRAGDREAIDIFRQHLGLADSGAAAADPHWRERDYILYRDGRDARLIVERAGEKTEFVVNGYALSDHPAIFAEFHAERDASGSATPEPVRRIDCHPTAPSPLTHDGACRGRQ